MSKTCAPWEEYVYMFREKFHDASTACRSTRASKHVACGTFHARIETTMVSLWHARRPPRIVLSNEIPCCHTPQTTEMYEMYGKNFTNLRPMSWKTWPRRSIPRRWSLKRIAHTINIQCDCCFLSYLHW